MADALALLRRLVATEPVATEQLYGTRTCVYCGGTNDYAAPAPLAPAHTVTCPWVAARAYVQGQEEA